MRRDNNQVHREKREFLRGSSGEEKIGLRLSSLNECVIMAQVLYMN